MGPGLARLEDKANPIAQITANGGTKIYQAVEAGFEAIVDQKATHKHIILLTDGVSTPGTQEDFPKLERDAMAKHVTISTHRRGRPHQPRRVDELAHKIKGKPHSSKIPEDLSWANHQRGGEKSTGGPGHSGTPGMRGQRAAP